MNSDKTSAAKGAKNVKGVKMDGFDRAAAWLVLQPRTEAEVRRYLKQKGYSPSEIDDTAERLTEYRYLDDTAYAESYIRHAAGRGWGRRRIDQELSAKGVSRIHQEEAWNRLEEECEENRETASLFDEKKRALETGVKMTRQHLAEGKTLDEKFLARVGRHLAGKGFSSDTIYFVVNKLRGIGR